MKYMKKQGICTPMNPASPGAHKCPYPGAPKRRKLFAPAPGFRPRLLAFLLCIAASALLAGVPAWSSVTAKKMDPLLTDQEFPVPDQDKAVLAVALQVAHEQAEIDWFGPRVLMSQDCVRASQSLSNGIFTRLTQQGFSDWRVRNIRATNRFHTTVMLTTPDGKRNYMVDNYLGFPQLTMLEQITVDGKELFIAAQGWELSSTWVWFGMRWRVLHELDKDKVDLCRCTQDPDEKSKKVGVVSSLDPNEKIGPSGVGEARYIAAGEPLAYAVFFENKSTATAPAQEVVITDQLDGLSMDLATFSLGMITAGDRTVTPPPGLAQYQTDLDFRPQQPFVLRIQAGLDAGTGRLTVRFKTIDPATGDLPADPLVGFLPPNQTPPQGEGSVLFSVQQKGTLPTGTVIGNQAAIVFDANPAMDTNSYTNTVDSSAPASMVAPIPADVQSPFSVSWAGADQGAGVGGYDVYVTKDGGNTFEAWLLNTPDTSAQFTGEVGMTYGFYCVARDRVGNREAKAAAAEALATVAAPPANPPAQTPATGTTTKSSTKKSGGSCFISSLL
ncbi:MAG: hypothetical protein AB1921_15460 [Thermodesulfobacteriota bacterium]